MTVKVGSNAGSFSCLIQILIFLFHKTNRRTVFTENIVVNTHKGHKRSWKEVSKLYKYRYYMNIVSQFQ